MLEDGCQVQGVTATQPASTQIGNVLPAVEGFGSLATCSVSNSGSPARIVVTRAMNCLWKRSGSSLTE